MRQELVAVQLAEAVEAWCGAAPLRVLDVGCGQGTQALRLARAGHTSTGSASPRAGTLPTRSTP